MAKDVKPLTQAEVIKRDFTDKNIGKKAPTVATIQIGDTVQKRAGDYKFLGMFKKINGDVRCVVEDDRGVLLIFKLSDLEKVG